MTAARTRPVRKGRLNLPLVFAAVLAINLAPAWAVHLSTRAADTTASPTPQDRLRLLAAAIRPVAADARLGSATHVHVQLWSRSTVGWSASDYRAAWPVIEMPSSATDSGLVR